MYIVLILFPMPTSCHCDQLHLLPTSPFPGIRNLVLFCDTFSLTRAIVWSLGCDCLLEPGRVICEYILKAMISPHSCSEDKASKLFLNPCLTIDRPVLMQIKCCMAQGSDCNGLSCPRRWLLSLLPIYDLIFFLPPLLQCSLRLRKFHISVFV